ncbi:hypothetical protein [Sulfuricurvum sp.]|uniref:hypothetical protein n=1 Tax=Sulfuricurvum sp. TaxID=2025608 RepID=UPI003BB696D8
MIEAEIKNKIPKLETWEDILTSNVFGLSELINYNYLIEILLKAKNHQGDSTENSLKNKQIKNIELWKSFKNIGEPDVLVTLDDDTFFIIEVKYFSHEHNKKEQISEEDSTQFNEKGQLAKYLNLEIDSKKSNFIIYLTADYQSLKMIENGGSTSKEHLDSIYHIHWNDFNEYLIQIECDGIEKKVINKIIQYLNFKGFIFWRGFEYKCEYDNLKTDIGGFYER